MKLRDRIIRFLIDMKGIKCIVREYGCHPVGFDGNPYKSCPSWCPKHIEKFKG